MKVYVVSQGTDGPTTNIFTGINEVFIGGDRIVRPESSTVLVIV